VNKSLLAICTWLALVSASYAQVTIKSASINYLTNPNQITVSGSGFCHHNALPKVTLAGTALTVISPCSNTTFTANLPPLAAMGTYQLVVRNSALSDRAELDVAYGVGSVGPMGPQGPQGPQGSQGPQGPQGLKGASGAQGPTGSAGAPGPMGPAGSQGPTGLTGPQGPIGNTGATGAQGPAGPAGAAGPAGPSGPTGATGPQGPSGLSSAYATNNQNGPTLLPNQDITVSTLSLPAGNFLLSGKVGVDFPSNIFTQDVMCVLQGPAATADSAEVNVQAAQAADTLVAIPLQGFVVLDSPSSVTMVCTYTTGAVCHTCSARSSSVGITAIQVDNLTPQ